EKEIHLKKFHYLGVLIMFTMLHTEIKKLYQQKSVWLALLIFSIATVHIYYFILSEQPISENIPYEANHVFYYFSYIQSDLSSYLMIVLPLLPLIVLGDSFAAERNSSILTYKLTRMNANQYIHSKLISLAITGFMFILQFLLFIGSLIFFPIHFPEVIEPGITLDYAANIFVNMPWVYVFLIIINSSLMASFITILSVTIGIFIMNRYVAVFVPFAEFIVVSTIMMSLPAIIGTSGIFIHDVSPLAMVGGYFTSDFQWWFVPLYWMILNLILYLLTVRSFRIQFEKEKLL